MKIFAVYNAKGGCSKTTTALAMLSYFTEKRKKAVVVDMDPKQRSVTFATRVRSAEYTIYDVLMDDVDINAAVVKTDFGFVIPGSEDLGRLDSQMDVREAETKEQCKEAIDNLFILQNKIKQLKGYDYIILDCPPGYENLAMSCMVAADELIIPAKASMMSLFALSSMGLPLAKAKEYNPKLKIDGVLLTQHNGRTNAGQTGADAAAELAKNFNAPVFKSVIRYATAIEDSYFTGTPLFAMPASVPVRQDYERFMKELMKKGGK